MSSQRLNQIERRAESYNLMDELPAEAAGQLPGHYLQDVPFLLGEIQRLQCDKDFCFRSLHRKNETITALKAEIDALHRRLKLAVEKYAWHNDVFSPPRVVKERKSRITNNLPHST